jgi:signal transduction histidine kinase
VRKTVSNLQHVVRNVTTGLWPRLRRLETWLLVTAAIAVPLLAVFQYRWLSEFGAAQRGELQQRWIEAVNRGAGAVNSDVSTFHAAVVEIGQQQPDLVSLETTVRAWRERATTLGGVTGVYVHDRATGRWVDVGRVPRSGSGVITREQAGIDGGQRDTGDDAIADVEFGTRWLAPIRPQSLPAMTIALHRSSEFDAVLLAFDADACQQLLRALGERNFESRMDVQLAIVEDAPAPRSICSDDEFESRDSEEVSAPIFRLQPVALPFARGATNQGSVGIAMSQDTRQGTWQLAVHGDVLSQSVWRIRTRNLWIAGALELSLVSVLILIAVEATRARRTAKTYATLSAVAAHELRTPLAAIKVLAQNQGRGLVRRDEQIVEYGNTLAAEADRLHGFVERVLQFTAGQTPLEHVRLESVDFERVISAALIPLQQRIENRGVTVRSVVEQSARMTLGDESGLVLAVRNLVQNALDHADGAQTIVVDVRAGEGEVVVSVADDGGGVPESDRKTLFEPFVRGNRALERAVPGHGLGLALVRDVARAHGGRATYQRGRPGSMFIFTVRRLPVRAGET